MKIFGRTSTTLLLYLINYCRAFPINIPKTPPGGRSCLLFFTGGSNFFKSSIYSEFIDTIQEKEIDVVDVPFGKQLTQSDIDILSVNYDSINALGHSSGCTTLFNQCGNLDKMKHIFLLDPVNTDLSGKKQYLAEQYYTISFIYAVKSYKITFDPFGLPFVPAFKLTLENLNIDFENIDKVRPTIHTLNIENYGHSDILDEMLSNIMHRSRISVGNKDRSRYEKRKYLEYISQHIEKTINYPTYLLQS